MKLEQYLRLSPGEQLAWERNAPVQEFGGDIYGQLAAAINLASLEDWERNQRALGKPVSPEQMRQVQQKIQELKARFGSTSNT